MSFNQPTRQVKAGLYAPVGTRNAYHQAGIAVAISIGNRQKQLPDVYFQIRIKPCESTIKFSDYAMRFSGKYVAKIEGGRLVQSLPLTFAGVASCLSVTEQENYLCAFDADVINLLVGSLSEAKYTSVCKNGIFIANPDYLGVLRDYGDKEGCEKISDYLKCFTPNIVKRKRKLTELFWLAEDFINREPIWQSITALAEIIMDANQGEDRFVISCEDVQTLLMTDENRTQSTLSAVRLRDKGSSGYRHQRKLQ